MNIPTAAIITGLAAISRLAAAASEAAPPALQEPAKGLDVLIRELSDESFRLREKASAEIWHLGDSALPALKEAAQSSDPEQAFRARDLLRKIQLHITPDTDPTVIALVERYLKASVSEKATLLGRMKVKRAWRQMLKLYASETEAEARERLREPMDGIALLAARERLAKGDDKSAREFLEMAPADMDSLISLAEFHRSHGSLEAELDRAKAVKGRKSLLWQLALHRVAGNLSAAREVATAAGETRIAAAMAALAGDPLPWLLGTNDDVGDDPVAVAYSQAAIRQWLGQKVRSSDLEPITRGLSARRSVERGAAMNALFLLGEVEAVEPTLVKSEPLAAFRHFQLLERTSDALKAFGFDPETPDYKPWIEKRLAKFTAEDIEDQHGVSSHSEELVTLANFLERKGQHDEAFAAFSEPLAALAEKDSGEFVDFLGKLFSSGKSEAGAPLLAKRVGVAWAADDADRWDELVVAGLGDDDHSSTWWDWLSEMAPTESRAERFDGLLALFNVGTDPLKLRKKWLERAWQAVDDAPAGENGLLAERIAIATMRSGDVVNCLRAWEKMPEKARESFTWKQHIALLSAVDRWQDAADVVLKELERVTAAKQEPDAELHAYAAIVLRRAGRAGQAAGHDAWVDKLVLGNPILSAEIGMIYQFGGDHTRALEWWARAVREAEPDTGEFAVAMKQHSDALLEQGRWKEAAATAEVIARLYANTGYGWTLPLEFMHQRLQANMARALANLKSQRAQSIATLEKCHRTFANDGTLADYFFPAIRKEGLIREHDEWFRESWNQMRRIIERYPESDNTRNTAAWFASRAMRNLDEAEKHLEKALASNPDQAAYLDTMAEIQFARGNRDKALEWSKLAVNYEPDDSQLRRQQERFRSDPLPK